MNTLASIALNYSQELLTIKEFVSATNYPIDDLYIDKFWYSLSDKRNSDRLVYVDDNLIQWMGYNATEPRRRKASLNDLLSGFNGKGVFHMSNEEYQKFLSDKPLCDPYIMSPRGYMIYPPPSSGKSSGKIVHLLITPETLERIMMRLNTSKKEQVEDYFIALNKLFFEYSDYQAEFRTRQSREESSRFQLALQYKDDELARARKQIELIETQNQDLIKYKLFSEKKEFVYIISTLADANKGLFKVGRTIDLSARIATYNTAHPSDDKMIYFRTWKCYSSKNLERRITGILFFFRHKKNKEYYKIRYSALVSIIDLIATHEGEEEEVIDAMAQEQLSAERNVDERIEWFTPEKYPDLLRIEYTKPKHTKVKPLTEDDIKPVVVLVINGLSSDKIKQSDLTEKIKQGLRDAKISPNRYKVSDWKSTINEALTTAGIRIIRR